MPGSSALGKRTPGRRPDDIRYRIQALANSLRFVINPLPAINPAPPTITHGTAQSLTRVWGAQMFLDRIWGGLLRGVVGAWDATNSRISVNARPVTLDFWVTDTAVEIVWVEAVANGSRVWTWVDGQPAEAPPTASPLTTSANATYVTKLTWSTRARRRVTIRMANVAAIYQINTSATGWLAATGRKTKIAIVADSYIGGSNGSAPPNGIGDIFERALDVEVMNEGVGGSGYITPGPSGQVFGDPARVARVAAFKPDLIGFFGSINDSSVGLQAAATATYAAYAAACPSVPQIVFGVQPTGASTTASATLAAVAKGVRDAAIAAPSVIAFHDLIGYADIGTLPTALPGASTTVTAGDRWTWLGSIWKALKTGNIGPGTPGNGVLWEPLTWGYSGNGTTSNLTGNGTRDVFVYGADGTHPTPEAAEFFGLAMADAVVQDLRLAVGQSA